MDMDDPDEPSMPPTTPTEHWFVWLMFCAVVVTMAHMLDASTSALVGLAAIVILIAHWVRPG